MNKIFKLSFVFLISLFNYLNSENYIASAKNWYENFVNPVIKTSDTKLADQQLIAHFIALVIEKNTMPSQANDQKLNGVMNTCPINNSKICDEIYEASRNRDLPALKAYYQHAYDNIPDKNRIYDGVALPKPDSFK